MAEAIGGKLNLLGLGLTGGLTPFRTLRKVSDIKKAKRELEELNRSDLRLNVDEKRNRMREYVQEHDHELKHAKEAVEILYDLLRVVIFDIHTIKSVIRRRYEEDAKLKGKKVPPEVGSNLQQGVERTRREVDAMLRQVSDMLGAETGR